MLKILLTILGVLTAMAAWSNIISGWWMVLWFVFAFIAIGADDQDPYDGPYQPL